MKPPETIFADFNNTDKENRVRLNTNGSLNDIKAKNIKMVDGLELLLDDGDEFKIKGVVEFSKNENIWVARCDWGNASNLLLSQ